MMIALLKGLLMGMAFGVVLYKVGASRYSRVMGMLTLRDTKIMKFAFTGVATASLLYGLASVAGVAEAWGLVPRVMPFTGMAHVVGGVLFGTAMGVSGLCPGTCMAKAGGLGGDRKFQAPIAISGLFIGVGLYSLLKEPLTNSGIMGTQQPLTLYGVLGLPYGVVAVVFGAAVIAIILGIERLTPEKTYAPSRAKTSVIDWIRGEWSWTAGGVAAGVLIVMATAQNGYLGFSGAVLALTGSLVHLVGGTFDLVPVINDDILWRAALIVGVLPGGLLAHFLSLPSLEQATHPVKKVLDVPLLAKTLAATTTMSLGAMIGGGCTTGAFIAGWPTLSLGSFAMAGTFFATSMVVSTTRLSFLHTLDMAQAQAIGDRAYD